ncbi:hypothetical protein [Actinophytocola sp.]|uniref:hypothetical protein n=1 Tax=Actinophytocola sp. TaxID=1872138 RepID=UPI002D805312|nr:hypothetical protein [Actinophytocola sp.]HET9143935.1 hypothetical protein [Actinophytocola sp.]
MWCAQTSERVWRGRVLAALVTAAVLAVAGCGAGPGAPEAGGHGHGGQPRPDDAANTMPSEPMTVEALATAVGCQTSSPQHGSDFRQANCSGTGEKLVLLDFDTAKGQREWVDMSKAYGGVYLVGNRWTVSGNSRDYMLALQARLGGAIEQDTHGS